MKTQISTTPEQSQRLIACGVNPDSADMYLSINLNEGENYGKYSTHIIGEDLRTLDEIMSASDLSPVWSLSALLDMMKDKKVLVAYLPKEKEWQVLAKINNVNHGCYSDSPIESCVKMLELMYKNDYTLNTK